MSSPTLRVQSTNETACAFRQCDWSASKLLTSDHGGPVPVVDKGVRPHQIVVHSRYSVTGVSFRGRLRPPRSFEHVLDVIIEYAEMEVRLKRLDEEINKTNRRANALKQITLPTLSEQVRRIGPDPGMSAHARTLSGSRRSRRRSPAGSERSSRRSSAEDV